jgi:hypothetical protein
MPVEYKVAFHKQSIATPLGINGKIKVELVSGGLNRSPKAENKDLGEKA